ncbi:MAG: DNA-directed RNA polymerase subunit alpha [Candidatus Pacebacteria bacterium]|nr:DNA-directed RNA polymerase subunit alpha [Candidatus Paceibacterota bacterium]
MILLPAKPKVINQDKNKAIFEIEGLYPGYGVTLGNSLRRVLFSSIVGASVTQVKIDGVSHEFTTKDGVLEDIITIVLNLKKLRFKMHDDESQRIILSVKGEKEVTGADFKMPTQVELINPEQHIATLTDKKAELTMEILVERGLGYTVADQQKREKLEVGQISVDAIFTPMRSVNFRVENMRVGKRTDFDKLFLEVETDGTIEPTEAFDMAAKILSNQFLALLGEISNDVPEEVEVVVEESVKVEEKTEDVLKMKIEDLGVGSRTINSLTSAKIKTVAGLVKKSRESLLEIDGMGNKGVDEIVSALEKLGLELK